MKTLIVAAFLLVQSFCSSCMLNIYSNRNKACKELVMLTVIHRHGDRTRDVRTYPTNPYRNEDFFPFGPGQLTNKGKWRMYNVGVQLRQRYQCFLGDLYHPDIMEARTTNVDRTKTSLAMVTAGLFPPRGPLIWSLLNWIPVPYNYVEVKKDSLLGFQNNNCPKYVQLLNEYVNGKGAELIANDVPFYKYVSKNSGWNVTSPFSIYVLYFSFKPEQEWGLQIPTWARRYLDTEFKKGAINQYKLQTATNELKKLSAGFFIKELLENSFKKIGNFLIPKKIKLFLYSAHEYNIANLLSALGVYNDIIPNYGSHIIIELRNINGVYGFRFLLQNYERFRQLQLLTIPGCSSFCPLDRFIELVLDIIPEDESVCNI